MSAEVTGSSTRLDTGQFPSPLSAFVCCRRQKECVGYASVDIDTTWLYSFSVGQVTVWMINTKLPALLEERKVWTTKNKKIHKVHTHTRCLLSFIHSSACDIHTYQTRMPRQTGPFGIQMALLVMCGVIGAQPQHCVAYQSGRHISWTKGRTCFGSVVSCGRSSL